MKIVVPQMEYKNKVQQNWKEQRKFRLSQQDQKSKMRNQTQIS